MREVKRGRKNGGGRKPGHCGNLEISGLFLRVRMVQCLMPKRIQGK